MLLADGPAVAALFERAGVLQGATVARGHSAIAAAASSWGVFVADPRTVVCGADLALVVGPSGTNVARRDPRTGTWRYVIAVVAGGR